jgi:RsiW-degrading membrane proteinase PrsW (M82 family)
MRQDTTQRLMVYIAIAVDIVFLLIYVIIDEKYKEPTHVLIKLARDGIPSAVVPSHQLKF